LYNHPDATDYYIYYEPGSMEVNPDGSALITGTVVANDNPAQQW